MARTSLALGVRLYVIDHLLSGWKIFHVRCRERKKAQGSFIEIFAYGVHPVSRYSGTGRAAADHGMQVRVHTDGHRHPIVEAVEMKINLAQTATRST